MEKGLCAKRDVCGANAKVHIKSAPAYNKVLLRIQRDKRVRAVLGHLYTVQTLFCGLNRARYLDSSAIICNAERDIMDFISIVIGGGRAPCSHIHNFILCMKK
jgi:hypothetical protein